MNGKREVGFICYKYQWSEGVGTMFQFFPDGEWDEDKLTLKEALEYYPIDEYEWVFLED